MLKRYQVLLPDWLEDYIKHLVDKYDMSFSEVIRAEICYSILAGVASVYPDYKLGITAQEISKLSKNYTQDKMERDEIPRLLYLYIHSKLYQQTNGSHTMKLKDATTFYQIVFNGCLEEFDTFLGSGHWEPVEEEKRCQL